jgi:hypothetical protein
MDWYPDPDESTLLRTPIRFATGYAEPVAGARWFRDTERRDIQAELPGWPAGPEFTLRSAAQQNTNRVGRAALFGIPAVARLVVEAVSGAPGLPGGLPKPRGKAREPENEVDDFPVMWAAPGTTARTLPWQLDPSRAPARFRVDAVVTERRLVLLGIGSDMTAPATVLWEAPRDALAGAERMEFSENGRDLRIRFADGSWARLSTGDAAKLTGILADRRRPLPEAGLDPGQRERVARFVAELPGTARAPRFFRLASGIVLVECQVPAKAGKGLLETHSILMGESGRPARPQPGDL